ncbi:MAG: EamA family transporter [Bacteroidales bacterium]|jgi:drug/metabolite transporter (DMT)-like permease|nr:EamA family transporter [Bacteroidales bacterium]
MQEETKPGLPEWMALVLLMLIWGSSFILIKRGLVSFSSMEVGALRISISFAVLVPFVFKRIKKVPINKLKYFALAGVVGNGIPPFLFAIAQTRIDSYLAGVLNSLTPLFTLLAGVLFFGVRTRWLNVLGVVVGLFGAVGLLTTVHDPVIGNGVWYGLIVVLATIFYAFNMNIIKKFLVGFDALTITSVVFTIIGIPAVIYLFAGTGFVETLATGPKSWEGLGYIAILAVFGTAISMVVHNWLIRRTSALFASTVTYMMPIVSIFWGFIDGEAFLVIYLLWIALILAGVYMANRPSGLLKKLKSRVQAKKREKIGV